MFCRCIYQLPISVNLTLILSQIVKSGKWIRALSWHLNFPGYTFMVQADIVLHPHTLTDISYSNPLLFLLSRSFSCAIFLHDDLFIGDLSLMQDACQMWKYWWPSPWQTVWGLVVEHQSAESSWRFDFSRRTQIFCFFVCPWQEEKTLK